MLCCCRYAGGLVPRSGSVRSSQTGQPGAGLSRRLQSDTEDFSLAFSSHAAGHASDGAGRLLPRRRLRVNTVSPTAAQARPAGRGRAGS